LLQPSLEGIRIGDELVVGFFGFDGFEGGSVAIVLGVWGVGVEIETQLCAFAAAGVELVAEEFFAEGVEFQLDEEFLEGGFVEALAGKFIDGGVHRDIGPDCGEFFGEACLICVGFDLFLLLALELVGVFQETFEGIELAQEFCAGFLADAGDAGNVVGRVTPHAEEVDDLFGAVELVFLADFGWAENFHVGAGTTGTEEGDVIGDELGEILVRGDHEDFEAFGFGLFGQGADDVVGFVAVFFKDGDVEGLGEFENKGDGGAEFLGHLLALGLVFGEVDVALGGS